MRNIWEIIALIMIYYIFAAKEKLQKIFLIIALTIYISISLFLNDNVKKASTHGNTKHGWYSKYNNKEKFIASTWFLTFPLGVSFLYIVFFKRRKEENHNAHESVNKNTNITNLNIPLCPKCNSTMVKRLAKNGEFKGKYFYGCHKFPKCNGITSIT